ncbi:MAG: glycosyltransferase family 2 protein [Gemmatimonadaceae bacterium]
MIRVSASIVSTGEGDRIRACLESLVAQRFDGALSVVVVVNGIDDSTSTVTRELFPDAQILRRDSPFGFAENHNDALAMTSFDFGLVLNPDVVLEPDCTAAMIDAMRRHVQAGVVVPLLSFPSGAAQPSARRFPRFAGTVIRRTPLRRLIGEARLARTAHYLAPPTEDRTVDWALGACLFVRDSAWSELGGFDPGYRPLYIEDVDLAWRMWNKGWEVWQTPTARAMHEHQAATDKVFFDRRTLWHMHGMLRFVRKHPRILLPGMHAR